MNIKPRAEGSRRPFRKILIVCEGERTEPNYFRGFRVASKVCEVRGTGYNTQSLVKEAERLAKLDTYREVWCVFDKDSFPDNVVDAAIKSARALGFKVAFSNECFELWFLLHYKYLDTGINRSEYCRHLKKILGGYAKNSVDMYDTLLDKQVIAISRAKQVNASHGENPNPAKCKPYTTVHELVQRLNQLALKSI